MYDCVKELQRKEKLTRKERVNEYLNRADVNVLLPHVPSALKRDRGSAAFKTKYGDQFKKLKMKKHHAVEVLKYM